MLTLATAVSTSNRPRLYRRVFTTARTISAGIWSGVLQQRVEVCRECNGERVTGVAVGGGLQLRARLWLWSRVAQSVSATAKNADVTALTRNQVAPIEMTCVNEHCRV